MPLAESERVFIAEIEHRGLTLSRKGFPALAAAIRDQNATSLQRYFNPGFHGSLLNLEGVRPAGFEGVQIRRVVAASNAPPASATSEALAVALIELRRGLGTNGKVELALMSLSPGRRDDLAGPWKGTAALRFVGSRQTGTGVVEILAKIEFDLAHVPDVDDIATAPAWVQSLRLVELQEALAPRPLLAEVALARGIDRLLFQDNWDIPAAQRPIVTGGIYTADVDGDGRQDVLVTDQRGVFLFRAGRDGQFTEVTREAGLPAGLRQVENAVFADFDGDGLVDLLLDTRAYRNTGGGRFEDVSARTGFRFGPALGFVVGDYDRDGRVDLYVARYHAGKMTRYGNNSWIDGAGGPGNQLWRNLGDWKFEEVSQKANAQAGRRSSFSSAFLDANNDGWPDIYVINEFGGGVLLVNQRDGRFQEQVLVEGDPGDFGSMGMAVGDYDNDGNIDIYTANMYSKAGRRIFENLSPGTFPEPVWIKIKRFVTGSEMYHNMGGLKFARAGAGLRVRAVGWAYGTAFVDLDNDGFLDLYGTAGFVSVNKEEPDG